MENTISMTITPLQFILSLALPIWIVVFPIIIIKKLNYLISLFQDQSETTGESSS